MDESNQIMTPDEEVAMIFSSDKDDGPSTSKKAKLMLNDQAGSSHDDTHHEHFQCRATKSRPIEHRRQIWDDSSDSSSSVDMDTKEYENVDAYLDSIPEFDVEEHQRIPSYIKLLGDYADQIRTDLPKSDKYSDEKMELVRKNFILSQLDYLIRENVRRTTREARRESKRLSLVKPLATIPRKERHKSE